MNDAKMMKLAGWATTFAAGFLLRSSIWRGDDAFGYISGFMMLGSSLIFTFGKNKKK
jgi:hypothetical protein